MTASALLDRPVIVREAISLTREMIAAENRDPHRKCVFTFIYIDLSFDHIAQYTHYSLLCHSLGEHALRVNGPQSLRTVISRDLGLKEGATFVAHPCHENA